MAERARLEIECTPKAYRGFKSPSLRCFQIIILARVVKLVDTYDSGSYGTTAVRVRVPSRAPFIEFFFTKDLALACELRHSLSHRFYRYRSLAFSLTNRKFALVLPFSSLAKVSTISQVVRLFQSP